jgi:hypothetical protein
MVQLPHRRLDREHDVRLLVNRRTRVPSAATVALHGKTHRDFNIPFENYIIPLYPLT